MDHPAAYARRIVVNLAIDHGPRRNRQRGELAIETDIDADPADPTAAVMFSRSPRQKLRETSWPRVGEGPLHVGPTSPTITFTDLLVTVIGARRGFERGSGLTRCVASGW
jgi:hypothetical protein